MRAPGGGRLSEGGPTIPVVSRVGIVALDGPVAAIDNGTSSPHAVLPWRRPMRIFMTGGTGMIGRPLVARLRARGDEVVIVSRSADTARRRPEFRGVRFVPGNPAAPGAWQDEVDGVDAVVNLAGHNLFARRWTASVRAEIRDSRVHATDHLASAVGAARSRPRIFVQGSAIGYYGPSGDDRLTESAPAGSDFLAVACRELEQAAGPVTTLGVRLATVRTGVVLGRGQGALGVMTPLFRWGGAAPVGSGDRGWLPARGQQWLSWIHIDDIVGLILLALDDPRASGPINGTAPEPARNVDFARALARSVRRPMLPMGPPDVLLRLLLGEVAGTVVTGQRVIPARALDLGYSFRHPDLAEAIASALRAPESAGLGGHPERFALEPR